MANIEYGSEIEFEDLEHEYVDSNGNLSTYHRYANGNIVTDNLYMNGYAFRFGLFDYFTKRNNGYNSPSFTNIMTVCLWTRSDSVALDGLTQNPLNLDQGSLGLGFGFVHSSENTISIRPVNTGSSSNSDTIYASYTLPNEQETFINSYHHYAVTSDGSLMRFFLDGHLIYTSTNIIDTEWANNIKGAPSNKYYNDYYVMKGVCLWTEDFEVPDVPLYEKYTMKNIGGSGWVPPTPPPPKPDIVDILKVY